jgi:hypothetical protein
VQRILSPTFTLKSFAYRVIRDGAKKVHVLRGNKRFHTQFKNDKNQST